MLGPLGGGDTEQIYEENKENFYFGSAKRRENTLVKKRIAWLENRKWLKMPCPIQNITQLSIKRSPFSNPCGGIASTPQLASELNLRMECELQRFGQCLCDSRPLAWVFLDATWVNLLILWWGFWKGFFGWLMIFTVFGRIMKIVKTTISLEWILLIIGIWGWWTHGKEAFYSDPRSPHGSTTICLLFFVCKVVSIRTVLWYIYIYVHIHIYDICI